MKSGSDTSLSSISRPSSSMNALLAAAFDDLLGKDQPTNDAELLTIEEAKKRIQAYFSEDIAQFERLASGIEAQESWIEQLQREADAFAVKIAPLVGVET